MKNWFQTISLILLSLFISTITFGQNENRADVNKPNLKLEKGDSIHTNIKDSSNNDSIQKGNAKIAIGVETDSKGDVISTEYISKKSSGSITQGMIDIAKRRAHQLKLGAKLNGIVIFNFKIVG